MLWTVMYQGSALVGGSRLQGSARSCPVSCRGRGTTAFLWVLHFGLEMPGIMEMPWPWLHGPGQLLPLPGPQSSQLYNGRGLDHITKDFPELLFYDYDYGMTVGMDLRTVQ